MGSKSTKVWLATAIFKTEHHNMIVVIIQYRVPNSISTTKKKEINRKFQKLIGHND